MRFKFNERRILFITYLLLILFFLQAQSVTGPYEQALRAKIGQPTQSLVQNNP
jgi:hypothetical protein